MSGDHNMYASGSGDGQRSGWRKRTIMELARDCGINFHQAKWPELERFAELVREEAIAEANARANASWTLMCEKMVAIEREAIIQEIPGGHSVDPQWVCDMIRARSNP
ncbi:hypothetical protein UFOVP272_35 [uncultured Caudovirales phage]|uniref:Uncharacterized protein n=1 Tax=uncultured Caudovirales phage TaxID=2100421 RepID=A0A6J5LJ86_9CAUD|nr:hypothetical protein UFOVP272_35 [uncultured Caudovirales phage]